jgi:hypothetical protein
MKVAMGWEVLGFMDGEDDGSVINFGVAICICINRRWEFKDRQLRGVCPFSL